MFVNNCNVILRVIMSACGDVDDCISTLEAAELAEKIDEKEINNLPWPGQVEFINGGPPCQDYRFNQGTWSKVQLSEWPKPMHVFASPELKVQLSEDTHYAAVRSTENDTPSRSITV